MKLRSFMDFWTRSASLAGMVLFIIAAAQLLSYILTVNLVPLHLAELLVGISHAAGTWTFMVIAILMLIVMGSLLEGAPALIIFGPLLIPIATKLGINPVSFSLILIIAMGFGTFAPPLGVGLYTACAVGGRSMSTVTRPLLKYLLVIFVTLLVIASVPQLTIGIGAK
jgi:TRAP-type C4-dicarboxylate transport system permease large subunit